MIKNASCVLKGDMTPAEELKIIQNFDLCSLGQGDLAHLYGKQVFGMFRPTDPTNTWTKWVRDYGVARWVKDYKLDLVMLDLVFDFGDPRPAIQELRQMWNYDINHPIMPNFSDFWTWTGKSADKDKNEWSLDLGKLTDYHFVQNAYTMSLHSTENWNNLRSAANVRLAAGKKLVLGIYDPGRQHEMLAALLMLSFTHQNLWWNYYTNMDDRNVDDQVNSFWGLAR